MQEFSHVSKHSAADLVAALNDSAASGWSVLSVTHSAADGFVAVPPLTARVTDLTGTLSADQRSALENARPS